MYKRNQTSFVSEVDVLQKALNPTQIDQLPSPKVSEAN